METICLIQEPLKKHKLNEEEDNDWNNKSLCDLVGPFFDTSFHFFPQKMLLGQACFVKGGNTYRLLLPIWILNDPCMLREIIWGIFWKGCFVFVIVVLWNIHSLLWCAMWCISYHTWIYAAVRHNNVQESYIRLYYFTGEFHCLFGWLPVGHWQRWYYALFQRWLLLGQPLGCLYTPTCFGLFTVKGIFVYIFVSLFWHLFHLTTGNFEALYLKNG
jgi:hypothetical protein